jgi:hypothetical protein
MTSHTSLDLPAVQWDRHYTRRQVDAYASEDLLLFPSLGDKQTIINTFLSDRGSALDPPEESRFPALRDYMTSASPAILLPSQPCSVLPEDIVLLDDRRDATGGTTSTRLWDSGGQNGYLQYSPAGESIRAMPLGIRDCLTRLREKVSVNVYISFPCIHVSVY